MASVRWCAGLVATLCAAVLAMGCGGKRSAECGSLAQVVNAGVETAGRQPKAADDRSGVFGLRALADAMDRAAADAGKVAVTTPNLRTLAVEYQTMARDVARSARDAAAAVDARDVARMNAAWAAMTQAYAREAPLVDALNKLCQGS